MYYEFRAPSAERIVVRLRAAGDLDAVVDVFQRTRSQLQQVGCEVTDRSGDAALEFEPEKDAIYVVRVGQRQNSKPGDFRLDVFAPEPPPRGPGTTLPAAGAAGVLDSLEHTRAAYSYRMRAGTTYRLNVAASACVALRVYPRGRGISNVHRLSRRPDATATCCSRRAPGRVGDTASWCRRRRAATATSATGCARHRQAPMTRHPGLRWPI